MKTYRQHNCPAIHRTHLAMAKCIWRRASWIDGNGPYAVVSYCGHGPHDTGLTVTLHPTPEAARTAKDSIDRTGCGGRCARRHDLIHVELP